MRVLLPTVTEPSAVTVSWLNALASRAPLDLRLVTVEPENDRGAPEPPGLAPGITISGAVRSGEPWKEILAEAASFGAGLITLPTRGLRGALAAARGSVSHDLIENATVPLGLLGPECQPAKALSTLVVALDGSAYAARGVVAMANVARELKLGVMLVQVFEPTETPLEPAGYETKRDFIEDSYLRTVVRDLAGVDVQWDVAHGDPAEAICDFAQGIEGAVVVMTSHGHAGWRRKLVGGVTEAVVANATMPVVVIPPQWSRTA